MTVQIAIEVLHDMMRMRPHCERWMSGCKCENCVRTDTLQDAIVRIDKKINDTERTEPNNERHN